MPGNWKDKRVFITGITGFIGSKLASRLLAEGAYVVGLSRTIDAWKAKVYRGDITDFDLLKSIISGEEIDTVFHLAANAIVRVSAKDPTTAYKTNIMGTCMLLEAIRSVGQNKVKSIIVASSDKAYGDHEELPYLEDHALKPRNTYDTSKACMDLLAQSFRHNYRLPIIVTRCSNVYGPGDKNISRIVPNTIRRAIEGKPALIYSDVECMEREFIYIDDVVDAYMLLGADEIPLSLLPAVNVGGGGPTKILDLVTKINEQMGVEERPIVEQRDPEFKEIQSQYIDAAYLEELGWERKVDLDEGIKRSIKWYKWFLKAKL
ncbi:MAG: NAD-dependent epimerase/dehydratase family protein [Candidatus Thorarchaeota archaeon]